MFSSAINIFSNFWYWLASRLSQYTMPLGPNFRGCHFLSGVWGRIGEIEKFCIPGCDLALKHGLVNTQLKLYIQYFYSQHLLIKPSFLLLNIGNFQGWKLC
jgi:hypothetical protein